MTCERHGGNAGSIMCRWCDLETIERYAMTTPTPKDTPPFDPPVFCSGIERDCKHGQLARSCNICELERELAAARKELAQFREDRTVLVDVYKEWQDRAERAEAREEKLKVALVKVLAHTEYTQPSDGSSAAALMPGLLASIQRIADAAIAEGKK